MGRWGGRRRVGGVGGVGGVGSLGRRRRLQA